MGCEQSAVAREVVGWPPTYWSPQCAAPRRLSRRRGGGRLSEGITGLRTVAPKSAEFLRQRAA